MNETDAERRQRIESSHDRDMPWTGDEARHWPAPEPAEPRPCKPYRFALTVTAEAESPEEAREVAESAATAVAAHGGKSWRVQDVYVGTPIPVTRGLGA